MKKNVLFVNTMISKNYVEIKCKDDILIYSSSLYLSPPTKLQIILKIMRPQS